MSQANELLESLNMEALSADEANEEHIVIGVDRIIEVPVALRAIAVQHDHNIETVTFDCPRYWDGYDLSTMKIYINYLRQDGVKGSYVAFNVVVDENDDNIIHFNWTISRNVTLIKGKIIFLVCAKEVNTDGTEVLHWNSERNEQMTVSEGLETGEDIVEEHPDVITQLLKRMDQVDGGTNAIFNIKDGEGEGSLTQLGNQSTGHKSVAFGDGTIASGDEQHVQGRYNEVDSEVNYAHIVGNGTKEHPSNAYTLDWEGNAWFAGGVKAEGNIKSKDFIVDEDGNAHFTKDIMVGGNLTLTGQFKVDGRYDVEVSKIGDIKITTRTLNDETWLLCGNDTKISEDTYPELYNVVSSDTNIFNSEWYSSAINNSGMAPVYSSDGYLYFVADDSTSVVKCKPDFTEFETFTRIQSGAICYENGYWFIFKKGTSFGTVYYSNDCFKTDSHELSFSVTGSEESAENSFARYNNGKWYISFITNYSDNKASLYVADALDGTFSKVQSIYSGYYGTYMPIADIITFANGNTVYFAESNDKMRVLYKSSDNASDNIDDWTKINSTSGWTHVYISEIDVVAFYNTYYSNGTNHSTLTFIKNDGSVFSTGLDGVTSFTYYKGYLYLKTASTVYRYNATDLESGYTVKTNYVTSYDISSSPDRLYMPKDANTMYYIENPSECVIPEIHPGTIFKTYIKCK